MKLSIRKKMLMLGGICLVSMLNLWDFLLQQSARKRKNSSNNKKFDQ
ncbi:TPA: hypothetical protein SB192_001670 [Campylobacter coli]|nr:hypothetical protein [Campylobacter coli]HEF9854591.1 hypothetical protein [Campylobacter coli]